MTKQQVTKEEKCEYVYRFVKGKQISKQQFCMDTITVFELKSGKEIGKYSWSRKPSEEQILSMVSQLVSDREIYKIWNHKK